MRNGVTMTGNSDQAYIGQKYRGPDSTDMVIQWSDNPGAGSYTPDHMRFIFTSNYSASRDTGCKSLEGLEAMRMYPVDSFNVNVGIGDFWKAGVLAGATVEPSERLDLVDRTIRMRKLIPDFNNDTLSRVVVVDGLGRLNWRRVSSLPTGGGGGTDCRWALNSPGNLITATGWSGLCVDQTKFVGIGIASPTAKLHVLRAETEAGNSAGIVSELTAPGGSGSYVTSISGGVTGSGHKVTGVIGSAFSDGNSTDNLIGVEGATYDNTGSASVSIGVKADARSNDTLHQVFGVHAYILHGNYTSRAGYFQGPLECTGAFTSPSDENLKENITDLSGAMDLLEQLRPKRFNFRTQDTQLATMNLATGQQMGLIAQEVANVLPGIVHDSYMPPGSTADGATTEGVAYKSMDYISLIPLLIGAVQELKDQLDACCAATVPAPHSPISGPGQPDDLRTERLLISPNPFIDHTSITYFVAEPGKVSLQVSDNAGRPISTLREEQAVAGAFTYEWDTQRLAAGTYFVALVVDGNVVVKRAVKVGER
jgi:hypothetical protein